MLYMEQNLDKGQHFMTDEHLLVEIADVAKLTENDIVLEVGSGKGALTKHLISKAKKIICVEEDTRYESPSLEVDFHHANILDIINDLEFTTLVANIPYHISEPLFIQLLSKKPKRITVVVGETFAKKLLGESILGIVLREVYDIELVRSISPSSFDPQPKVYSALLTLALRDSFGPLYSFYEFQSSKVKNYIISLFEGTLTKKETKQLLLEKSFAFENKKLFELSTEEFLELRSFVNKILFS